MKEYSATCLNAASFITEKRHLLPIDPLEKFKSLKDHVYQYLSEKINDGSLLPETKISEKTVINDLGISRTPVREAMIQLAAEGYLENIPRRGFVVKQVDRTKAKEVYGLLGVLEGYAASLAVAGMDEAGLEAMNTLYAEMKAAIESSDIRLYYILQHEFHDIFIQKSGNQELGRAIRRLKKIFIRQTYVTDKGQKNLIQDLRATNEEHLHIIELFEQKADAELDRYLRECHWDIRHADYDVF